MLKNKILYIVLLIGAYAISILYPSLHMAIVVRVMIVMPIISIFILLISIKNTKLEISIPNNIIIKNDIEGVPIQFTTRSTNIFNVMNIEAIVTYRNKHEAKPYKNCVKISKMFSSKVTDAYLLYAQNVGVIEIVVPVIYYYDWLKIWRISKKINIIKDIKVLPQFTQYDQLITDIQVNNELDTDIYSNYQSGNDRTEVFDVREYKDGDNLRDVHWKLSTKKDKLHIKEFSLPITRWANVFVELSIPEKVLLHKTRKSEYYLPIDNIMSVAQTLSSLLAESEIPHTISWYNDEVGGIEQAYIQNLEESKSGLLRILDSPLYEGLKGTEMSYLHKVDTQQTNYSELFYITDTCNYKDVESIVAINHGITITIILVGSSEELTHIQQLEKYCLATGVRFIRID